MSKTYRIYCDSCEALAINGTPCHEHGCPRSREKWVFHFGRCYPEDVELQERMKVDDETEGK